MIIYTSKVKKIAKEHGKMVGRDYLEALDGHIHAVINGHLSQMDVDGKKIMKADLVGIREEKASLEESRTGDDVKTEDSAQAGVVSAEDGSESAVDPD